MPYTQEELERSGYRVQPAPVGDWRVYDERQPVPPYFAFDWLSSRHPDLYHAFALSSVALIDELHRLLDLTGLDVLEIGAGTGRSAMEAARKAKTVTALDIFESVVWCGQEKAREAGFANIRYARGNRACLPFADRAFDACLYSWAEINYAESCRVLKPGGWLVLLGAAPGALCGELTPLLAEEYPDIILEVAPPQVFDPACPAQDTFIDQPAWLGLPVIPPVRRHDFTCCCDYGDSREAAAIVGRLYGPKARQYLLDRRQSSLLWRLRIEILRIKKSEYAVVTR